MYNSVQEIIEQSWERDDRYLVMTEKQWLVENNLFEVWKEDYLNDVIEKYRGTCNFISQKDENFLSDYHFHARLDDEIFNCANCGWWCEIYEASDIEGDIVCQDCQDEYNETR